jgi:hypothetical protein
VKVNRSVSEFGEQSKNSPRQLVHGYLQNSSLRLCRRGGGLATKTSPPQPTGVSGSGISLSQE